MTDEIAALVRSVERMTAEQIASLCQQRKAIGILEWGLAIDAAWGAAEGARLREWVSLRDGAWHAAQRSIRNPVGWNAIRGAASALALRDRVGQKGFELQHYDTLVRPWVRAIGATSPLMATGEPEADSRQLAICE